MTDDVAVKVDNVSKVFKLPNEKHGSLKSIFVNFYRRDKGYDIQRALNDVSFEIKKGEFFGIVGRNGSGKSTLLKILAGIYTPTSGGVEVRGKLIPFIELGVGFNQELTAKDNVFLNGALLGFTRQEMQSMYKDIVEFAELEKFMNQKLKNFSSGMQVRLAFSIAIRARGDILLIDEVLAVGDENFQRKCLDYFNEIKSQKRTVVFVSHDMETVRRYCDRAVLIHDSKIMFEGDPDKAAYEYEVVNAKKNSALKINDSQDEWGSKEVEINSIKMVRDGKELEVVEPGSDFDIQVSFKSKLASAVKINASLGVFAQGTKCFDISTYYTQPLEVEAKESGKLSFKFKDFRLLPGVYNCNISLFDESMNTTYHGLKNIFSINVVGSAKKVKATGLVLTNSEIIKL